MIGSPRLTRHLYLIGLRGTGKSTVGRLLAERLRVSFFDADEELERDAGRTIREIFAEGGEVVFRELEESMLESLSTREPAVIATGGGVVLRQANRRRMRETGRTFWLTAGVDEMCRRMQRDAATTDRRPDLTVGGRAEVEQMMIARESMYRDCADAVIETEGRSPGDVAEAILLSCSTFS